MYVSVCMHRNWIACCTSSLVDATEKKKLKRNEIEMKEDKKSKEKKN